LPSKLCTKLLTKLCYLANREIEMYFSRILADVKSVLHKQRSDGKKAPLQKLTTMQKVYVSRLILKHGDNYVVSSHLSNQSMLNANLCCFLIIGSLILNSLHLGFRFISSGVVETGFIDTECLLQAMSKDIKLNRMQHPPGALKLLCERFHKYEKLSDYSETQETSKE
jgi:hypothetical protein